MADITFYGHSTFLIHHNGINILFDPFITENDSASHIDIEQIPADYILITHGHFDHVLDVETIAKRTGAKIIANFEVGAWFSNVKNLQNVTQVNHGGMMDLDFGTIKYVNAVHTSSLPDVTYGGQPGGFVVFLKNGPSFYYSGDTALTYDMKLIGEQWTIDFAMLCIGDHFTMGVEDAIRAAEFTGAYRVIGMHYDTFPPIELDKAAAKKKFDDAGRNLILMEIGETLSTPLKSKKAA